MLDAAEEQSAILAQAADSDQPVDMLQHMARITLNATGMTVFGCADVLQGTSASTSSNALSGLPAH